MDEAVEDGGQRGFSDAVVPEINRILAGDQGGAVARRKKFVQFSGFYLSPLFLREKMSRFSLKTSSGRSLVRLFLFLWFFVLWRVLLGDRGFGFHEAGPSSFLETEGLALDVDRRRMMEQTVQNRRGQGLISEDVSPDQKAFVGGQDEAGLLVASAEEPEEQTGFFPGEGQVPDLIQNQELGECQHRQGFFQLLFHLGLPELSQEVLEGEEQHPIARFHGLDSQGDREMRFSHSWRTEEDHVFGSINEGQTGQFPDRPGRNRGLEGQIEGLQRLHHREAGQGEAKGDPFLVATLPFDPECFRQKTPVIEVPLPGLLQDPVQTVRKIFEVHLVDEGFSLHVAPPRKRTGSVSRPGRTLSTDRSDDRRP